MNTIGGSPENFDVPARPEVVAAMMLSFQMMGENHPLLVRARKDLREAIGYAAGAEIFMTIAGSGALERLDVPTRDEIARKYIFRQPYPPSSYDSIGPITEENVSDM